jgi:hypothetical protein
VPVTGIREEKQGLPDWEIHNLESTLIVLLTREQKENNKKPGGKGQDNRPKHAQATTRKRQERTRGRKWRRDKTLGRRNSPGSGQIQGPRAKTTRTEPKTTTGNFITTSAHCLLWSGDDESMSKHESGCGRPDDFLFFPFSSVCSEFAEDGKKAQSKAKAEDDDGGGTGAALLPEDPVGMRRFVIHVLVAPPAPKRNEQFLSLAD